MSSELNVSLPPHLVDLLKDVQPSLPKDLQSQLSPYVADPSPATIPYHILLSLSQHVHSPSCTLSPEKKRDYSMVSLLAGCITSPERSFPDTAPQVGGMEIKAEYEPDYSKRDERRAIVALVNAVGSVVGSGVAAYWASGQVHWRNEWRVLFGLFAGFVVAASEAILYLIWSSRRASDSKPKPPSIRDKKLSEDVPQEPVKEEAQTTAKESKDAPRKRKGKKTT